MSKEVRKPEFPEKDPEDQLQEMPHAEVRKFKPQPGPGPALQQWWQALDGQADPLTIISRVAPIEASLLCVGWLLA